LSDHAHDSELSDIEAKVKALETLLVAKGLVNPAAVDAIVETYETKVGPRIGAGVVAKAWVDAKFADWLRTSADEAIRSLGIGERPGGRLRAVFNTPDTHNVIVCTLCSCYPWSLLGLPPTWYKAPAFRSRAVLDPRGLLGEFGLHLPQTKDIRVWDSTAELRYLVIPERPAGTENLSESELAALVSRDAMIGTAVATFDGATK
jgi:nitrile hydratase